MWRAAQEYSVRTGRDGFNLGPYHLYLKLRTLQDIEARQRTDIFRGTLAAIGVAFGDEKAGRLI